MGYDTMLRRKLFLSIVCVIHDYSGMHHNGDEQNPKGKTVGRLGAEMFLGHGGGVVDIWKIYDNLPAEIVISKSKIDLFEAFFAERLDDLLRRLRALTSQRRNVDDQSVTSGAVPAGLSCQAS